jgi:hypothetical protein
MCSRIQRRSWRTDENTCYVDWQGALRPLTRANEPRNWEPIFSTLSPYWLPHHDFDWNFAVWARWAQSVPLSLAEVLNQAQQKNRALFGTTGQTPYLMTRYSL